MTLASSETNKQKRASHLIRKTKTNVINAFGSSNLSHKAKLAHSLVCCSTSFLMYLLSDYYFLRERWKVLWSQADAFLTSWIVHYSLFGLKLFLKRWSLKKTTEHFINSWQKVRYSSYKIDDSIVWVLKHFKSTWQCYECLLKRIYVIILRVFFVAVIKKPLKLNSKSDPSRDLCKNMGKWQHLGVCVGREESDLATKPTPLNTVS